MSDTVQLFVAGHRCVRNDEQGDPPHFGDRTRIRLARSRRSACRLLADAVIEDRGWEFKDEDEDGKRAFRSAFYRHLKMEGSVWVPEWERRGSGDLYWVSGPTTWRSGKGAESIDVAFQSPGAMEGAAVLRIE